ncbi:hypothetical protein SASPL_118055 [Salvia splendens]|uniref:Uncharacterized protein n=1 Tax=Salvia splendens TaxID=180675 RepID=A0A8X8Y1P0_SALSN|nr:hypothetical protein SASPL_118055 [Salvia splendens]
MEPSPLFTDDPARRPKRLEAGIISRIHLENFMCHSNLDIEWKERNINGTLCRIRLPSSCSALVQVEIKNQGEDAFKHELYGDTITVERRISESAGGSITLKTVKVEKLAPREMISDALSLDVYRSNFIGSLNTAVSIQIDVENPCTIMTQDKSREFLHSGNDKDKFKFYFKATLLQQVDDLLSGIDKQLQDANGLISHLEDSLRPAKKELDELQEKIKNMEIMEEMSQQVQLLRKKLAWSWVYDADRKLDVQHTLIEKLKGRIPSCQAMIDQNHHKMEKLNDRLAAKKDEISNMMERTSEVRRLKEDLQQNLSMAVKEQLELTGEQERINRQIDNMVKQVRSLERQIQEMHEQYQQNTQAEENEMEERLRELQAEVDKANVNTQRLKMSIKAIVIFPHGYGKSKCIKGIRFPESIDDLRMLHEKKERKISRKLRTYKAFKEKLEACEKALNVRWGKFQRNATLLKRQLTWQFNGHLKKKGISGQIKVSYEEQTLSVEVKMPQDASSSTVRDTSGLSGGERSFSTLCFALALHEMTEAPFRAMDEFDVFMDAVSRKISLDAIVDFALAQVWLKMMKGSRSNKWLLLEGDSSKLQLVSQGVSTISSANYLEMAQILACSFT